MIVSEVYDDNDWNAKLQTTGIVVGVSMNKNAVNIKKIGSKSKMINVEGLCIVPRLYAYIYLYCTM